jgi:protein SCO1/2
MRNYSKRIMQTVAGIGAAWALVAISGVVADHGMRDAALAQAQLPYYSNADLSPRRDWLSRRRDVGSFVMRDQHGHQFDQSVLDHGPTVVSFFFTNCVSACPLSIEMLQHAQARMAAKGKVAPTFLSISALPLVDDPGALRNYARSVKLAPGWRLATGEPEQIYKLAQRSFFSDISQPGPDGLPAHLTRAFLVDREHRVRGIYDATSPADISRLQRDVAML